MHFHGGFAALDDEEHEPAFTLERDRVPGREAALVELLGEAFEVAVLEGREQWNLTEQVSRRL